MNIYHKTTTMNNLTRISYLFLLASLTACGGRGKNTAEGPSERETFIEALVETRILENEYSVSIPPNYAIEEMQGADFVVFYIKQADTVKSTFAAGIYFGNHPNKFNRDPDTTRTTTVNRLLLGQEAAWTIERRDSSFSVETLVESGDDTWREYIHAFGSAHTESDLEKLFDIFGTLSEHETTDQPARQGE